MLQVCKITKMRNDITIVRMNKNYFHEVVGSCFSICKSFASGRVHVHDLSRNISFSHAAMGLTRVGYRRQDMTCQ